MTYNKQTGLTFEWGLGRVLQANQQTRKKEPIRMRTEIQVRCWGSWNKKTVAGSQTDLTKSYGRLHAG
jgi:hypothetical protein